MKLQETLHNWGGVILNCVTDEEIQDIDLAINYHDHGDDFLYVRTKNGEHFEYGYWLNRDREFHSFIKEPNLYFREDERSKLSNEVFRVIHNGGLQEWMDFGPRKYNDADRRLKRVIMLVKAYIRKAEDNRIRYDFKSYLDYIRTFIVLNELKEEEYELDNVRWNSRINGFDGEAGKMNGYHILEGDGITKIFYRGKEFDIKKVSFKRNERDEWGCCTKEMNTNQFC